MNKIIELYKKYKEIINYLIVGVLTTLVSIIIYFISTKIFHINYMISSAISWVGAVIFAYITNKKYVFLSKSETKKEIIIEIYQFFKYRIISFIIELLLMYAFVELIKIDDMISKIIVQVIVIILNYIFSKLFVFKKNTN